MKSKFSKILILLFLFMLFLIINSYIYATTTFSDLSSNIFRLHIIANSDSEEDQILKLKVRDEILKYLENKTKDCKTKNEVKNIVSTNIIDLQKIAVKTINDNGYNYNVSLEIGNFKFPTKYYGNISMPARKL